MKNAILFNNFHRKLAHKTYKNKKTELLQARFTNIKYKKKEINLLKILRQGCKLLNQIQFY